MFSQENTSVKSVVSSQTAEHAKRDEMESAMTALDPIPIWFWVFDFAVAARQDIYPARTNRRIETPL